MAIKKQRSRTSPAIGRDKHETLSFVQEFTPAQRQKVDEAVGHMYWLHLLMGDRAYGGTLGKIRFTDLTFLLQDALNDYASGVVAE